jgi:hypothetical protein
MTTACQNTLIALAAGTPVYRPTNKPGAFTRSEGVRLRDLDTLRASGHWDAQGVTAKGHAAAANILRGRAITAAPTAAEKVAILRAR